MFAFWGLSMWVCTVQRSGRVPCRRMNMSEMFIQIIDVKFVWNIKTNVFAKVLQCCTSIPLIVVRFVRTIRSSLYDSHVNVPVRATHQKLYYLCDFAFVDTWQTNWQFLSRNFPSVFLYFPLKLNWIQCVIWYNCCTNNSWIDVIIVISIVLSTASHSHHPSIYDV